MNLVDLALMLCGLLSDGWNAKSMGGVREILPNAAGLPYTPLGVTVFDGRTMKPRNGLGNL